MGLGFESLRAHQVNQILRGFSGFGSSASVGTVLAKRLRNSWALMDSWVIILVLGLPPPTWSCGWPVVLWERSSTEAPFQDHAAPVKFDDDKPLAKQEAMIRHSERSRQS
jgi:hypothetical protein